MPLIIPTAPADVMTAFTDGLPLFLAGATRGTGQVVAQGHVGAPPVIPTLADVTPSGDAPLIHDPQEVFVVTLDANGNFTAPKPAGWRAYAGTQQFAMAMGRVTRRPPHGQWKMTACYYGDPVANRDQVWASYDTIAHLRILPDVQTPAYNLRVLTVPMLNLETFWLTSTTAGETDLVIPYPLALTDRIPALKATVAYQTATFYTMILPLARRMQAAHAYSGA